jgi:hypothetical protein
MRETVLTGHFPEKDVEFALCFGGREVASAFLQGFFVRRPELLALFHEEVSSLVANGRGAQTGNGFAESLAALAVKHELRLPSDA